MKLVVEYVFVKDFTPRRVLRLSEDGQNCVDGGVGACFQLLDGYGFDLTVRDLCEDVRQGRRVVGTDHQLILMLAVPPDVLVGIVAQTSTEVTDRTFREHGVVVLTADHLKFLFRVHAVEVNRMIEVVVQKLVIALCERGVQVEHRVVVGAEIQILFPVLRDIGPEVAAHGVIDTETERHFRFFIAADHLCPGKITVRQLFAAVHRKALLMDDPGVQIGFVGDNGDIQVAVILDDVPDTAAVQTVRMEHAGQEIKILLVRNDLPVGKTLRRIGGGYDDTAGRIHAVSIVVRACQTHQELTFVFHKAMHTVGHFFLFMSFRRRHIRDLLRIGDFCGIRFGIYLDQRGGRIAHAGEIELAVEFDRHTIAGQNIEVAHAWILHKLTDVIRMCFRVLRHISTQSGFPEDDFCLIGILVDRHDNGIPLQIIRFIERIHTEHRFHDVSRSRVRIGTAYTGGDQRVLDRIMINVEGRVIAGTDVDVIPAFCHGPGVRLSSFLRIQNAVQIIRSRSRV